MKWNLFMSILALSTILACHNKSDNTDGSNSESQSDLYIASALTAADEATDAIAENGTSSSFEPLEQDLEPLTTTGTITRTCTTSGTDASILLTFTGAESLSFSKTVGSARVSIVLDITKSGTSTRLWSPAACDGSGTFASVNWAVTGATSGLSLTETLNRAVNRTKTISITKANGLTRNSGATDDVTITGTRNTTWGTPNLVTITSGTGVSRTKTINSNVTRVRTFTRASGTTISATSTVTVGTGTPLNVTVVRKTTDKILVSKTINSGTITVTESDGSLTSCAFSSVTYDLSSTNTNKCVPTSGTITCEKLSSATATTATSTQVIKFGDTTTTSGISISVDGATADDLSNYNTKGCDLESAT